jgi:hypothetical protein
LDPSMFLEVCPEGRRVHSARLPARQGEESAP